MKIKKAFALQKQGKDSPMVTAPRMLRSTILESFTSAGN